MDATRTDRAPTWQLEILDEKYLRHTVGHHRIQGKWNPNTKNILEDTRINEDLLYKEMTCPSRLGPFKEIPIRKRLLHQGRDVNLLLL